MEFNEKLQELRKQRGLTQDELAEKLFVSRTAISKWESGRGYPNIESLKAISKFFGITVDELLSGEELLILSQADTKNIKSRFRDVIFGLLDISVAMLLFLPFFNKKADGMIYAVSLLTLADIAVYLKTAYFIVVIGTTVWGVITLSLQGCEHSSWLSLKYKISLLLNIAGTLLFVISQQPYAAVLLMIFLVIKASILIKK